MPIYKLRGIDVDFPFEAYDCQLVYMEKVIQSLQEKCNALLESPTGTGKTLCLLCATLAWRKSLGDFSTGPNSRPWGMRDRDKDMEDSQLSQLSQSSKVGLPMIVYTSRTHSQLQQVIQELKRTNYRPKMSVLGSREQLCIHDDVRMFQGRAQINACHFVRKRHKCSHLKHVSGFAKNNRNLGDDPIDIEDLVNIGRKDGPCPYYVSRELHKVVDILFAPYNYLIDHRNRKSLAVDFQNSVLIFDEAHNLEGICADAASFDLPSSLLTSCVSEARKCEELSSTKKVTEKSDKKPLNPENFRILKALILLLEKRIAEVPIESKDLGFTRPGPYIYDLLAELNITYETATMLIDTIDSATSLLEEDENSKEKGAQKAQGTICRLESLGDILRIIFRDGDKSHGKFYRVHVQESEANAFKGKKASRTLSWWCFNPGVAMEEFSRMGVGSIILTSGTLSPLDSFAQELKLKFPVQLENPHVISSKQIWAGVVPSGPSACSFNSSYKNRDSLEYKQDLGNAIANFARIVPSGLLVFFPSYYLLDQCIDSWKDTSRASSSTVWERICKHKQPVVEPRQSSLFTSAIEDFMTKLNDTSTSGAVFFAVCRGKVSEGLDFADHAGRAVVITGMPFAMRTDPKIRLKREYLDQEAEAQKKEYKVLTGEEWYSQQASRAVNQAVGRVIRHRHDYGAIIFCDERFAHSNRQSQMSRWLQPHIQCYSRFGEVVFTLTRFFRDVGICGPTKAKLTETISMGIPSSKLMLHEGIQERKGKGIQTVSESSSLINNNTDVMSISQLPVSSHTRPRSASSMATHLEKPLSSGLANCRENTRSHLGEILPANCSTLSSYKQWHALTLKHSQDLHKKDINPHSSDPMRKSPPSQNLEVIDLTSNDHDGQKNIELIVPCSSKKPRLLKIDPDLSNYSSFTISKKNAKQPQIFSCEPADIDPDDTIRSTQNAQDSLKGLLKDPMTTQKTPVENKIASFHPAPRDDGTRASSFLKQVKEELSDPEYKDFLGYMTALKSNTMKISDALQSIARLFSNPKRHLLLVRFKDYVPAKYRPMYEQYTKSYGAPVDS